METIKSSKREWQRDLADRAQVMDFYSDGNYAMSRVLIDAGDGHVATGVGFCKLKPGDVWKDNVAAAKSRGRAIGVALKAIREQADNGESL